MFHKDNEEFSLLKEHLRKVISQNETLRKENEALKRVIQNLDKLVDLDNK